ncbi:MAG: FAA hydrolase family protein [Acidobacteria bacterium]|nr:MAG: FAA hydrolase family protein [Acidobacteriota bacterium]REK01415.1 MAG: FAA hydrolase family protein [Acidobacteriota bacterium]REK14371.1 MAG: FAA hydrolase family protein [Acidobacteriota bacterium]REK45086.1 MAG: FAA hydrolase family protein [Acidobacteriota bacterium]
MRICRIRHRDNLRFAECVGDSLLLLPRNWKLGDPYESGSGAPSVSVSAADFTVPVNPSKIVCVGRNYAAHAKELNNPVPASPLLFLKAPSSLIADGDPITIPSQSSQVEHEGELGVVIGRRCKDLSESDSAIGHVLGFVCANDVTARDLQKSDVQFTRAKSFDTFCPIGRFVETSSDVSDVLLSVYVNGSLRQNGRTSEMIFDIPFLIRYISRQMTLNAGDLLLTGTPSGVSRLLPGDICKVQIESVGSLSNPVQAGETG